MSRLLRFFGLSGGGESRVFLDVWFALRRIEGKIDNMAVDLRKLNAAVARVVADIEAVLPHVEDPVAAAQLQASLDALADTLDTESSKLETGATGPVGG